MNVSWDLEFYSPEIKFVFTAVTSVSSAQNRSLLTLYCGVSKDLLSPCTASCVRCAFKYEMTCFKICVFLNMKIYIYEP